MTRERTDATDGFYQAWVPNMTHIITFERQLNKQQKKMQSNKCHHLRQSQNATICWPDAQKQLFHQRVDDKI
jgi:hypothetical protein